MLHTVPVLFLLAAAPACIQVDSDSITLGDLAKVVPQLSAAPATTRVGYSPQPGERRIFTLQNLSAILERAGLSSYSGPEICVERESMQLSAELLLPVLLSVLRDDQTRVELLAHQRGALPVGRLQFERSGLTREAEAGTWIWRGKVVYGNHLSRAVWVRVILRGPSRKLYASRPIEAGQVITEHDFREVQEEGLLADGRASKLPGSIVGMRTGTAIQQGQEILPTHLKLIHEVRRGDAVSAHVPWQGGVLRFKAVAETGGPRGARILLRSTVSPKLLSAYVVGPGEAIVRLTEAQHTGTSRMQSSHGESHD